MVFGEVIAVEAEFLVKRDQPQSSGVFITHGLTVEIDVVEDAELHHPLAHSGFSDQGERMW